MNPVEIYNETRVQHQKIIELKKVLCNIFILVYDIAGHLLGFYFLESTQAILGEGLLSRDEIDSHYCCILFASPASTVVRTPDYATNKYVCSR